MKPRVAALAILGFLVGCAPSSIASRNLEPRMRTSEGPSSVLSGAELAGAIQSESLLAALVKFRPSFLAPRGRTLLVSVDGMISADVELLRGILVSDVCDVRLERGTSNAGHSAVLPDGRVSSGGDLIAVTMRQNTATPCVRR
jgi:hypothetical protein